MAIRNAVQCGEIQQAIERTNAVDPAILAGDTELSFKLKQQQLVELIRSGGVEEALTFAQAELSPLAEGRPASSQSPRLAAAHAAPPTAFRSPTCLLWATLSGPETRALALWTPKRGCGGVLLPAESLRFSRTLWPSKPADPPGGGSSSTPQHPYAASLQPHAPMHPGQPAFLEELERSMLLLAYSDLRQAPTAELLTQAARQKTVRAPPPHRRRTASLHSRACPAPQA
jgi:hypothetical protein